MTEKANSGFTWKAHGDKRGGGASDTRIPISHKHSLPRESPHGEFVTMPFHVVSGHVGCGLVKSALPLNFLTVVRSISHFYSVKHTVCHVLPIERER